MYLIQAPLGTIDQAFVKALDLKINLMIQS